MVAINVFLNSMYEAMAPVWVELGFLLLFALGFLFLRLDRFTRGAARSQKKVEQPREPTFDPKLQKQIEADAAAGNPRAVLAAWRAGRHSGPTPQELIRVISQAFVESEPSALQEEIVAHMQAFGPALIHARTATAVMDVVARAGRIRAMEDLWEAFHDGLHIPPSCQVYEVLLGGFASVGDEAKVKEYMGRLKTDQVRLTARGYSLTIKGYLKNSMVDAVLEQIRGMQSRGFHVPSFAVTQFFRIACDSGRAGDIFDAARGDVTLSAESVILLLEDCFKRSNMDLARRVEEAAREKKVPFMCNTYDFLLKLYTVAGDLHALKLFAEMQASGNRISERLCVGLLSRCADAKFLRFAEEIVRYTRSQDGMTIAVYSAFMKVYAYCGMYDRACELYDQILEDGLEPDVMMYGCLMKFAVECGRTDLSRELSERAPSLDIQNYMSLIRAAGRDKDVDRAFAVLRKLKESGVASDVAAYNCVLDVCVSGGDMRRARKLTEEMRTFTSLDIITYNTLLKGYCVDGALKDAQALLVEMREVGLPPNDVSYNCLINSAVSSGNFREAWDTIEMMEKSGVAIDHYTISIMMKALKKVKNPQDVARALQLLDRSGLNVCADEIMLNTVLETCIRHREFRQLEAALAAFAASNLRPSVHTYGSLIKACSTLKRVDRCWEFWREMTETRALEPNDIVLGCMLDALVCSGQIEEAVKLLEEWEPRVPINTVICSTIIKGFANTHQSGRAMKMWREMRQKKVVMNTVVYNALIDAQARTGAMEDVSELVQAMAPDGCVPDSITHSTIMKGYCVRGDLHKAFDVFRNMQKNGMASDAIIYNTILNGCTRQGHWDVADQVLKDMETLRVVPSNFTLGILVKMYGRRHQLDQAFMVVETLPKQHGFAVNAQVSTSLMCACLNNNALDRAFQVFLEMKNSAQGADAKAYGALISGCVRHGQFLRAVELVDEAYGLPPSQGVNTAVPSCRGLPSNQALEPEPVEQLLRALTQKGMMEQVGAPLLERLRAAKAPVSERLFASMLGSTGPCGTQQQRRGGGGKGSR